MKRQWKVRREFRSYPDGEQRWDRVYQYLLQWTELAAEPARPGQPVTSSQIVQEVDHASGHIRPSLDSEPSRESNH
jgi:hypothetical protein